MPKKIKHRMPFSKKQRVFINQRKTWGNRYIKMLASELKEYGKGYSTDQLKRMTHFASYFSESEISAQAVHQIPWSTLSRVIIQKSSSEEETLWYVFFSEVRP